VRGLEVVRGVGEGNVKRERVAAVVRRTRKVEGWLGGTGGAVRAQHDAIRAGTRRSLRSERRDASAESVAWIARSVIAGTRGVPLSSRITLAVCSAEGVVSLLSSCEPPRREEGRRGGVPYHRSCSCVSIRPEELSLSLSLDDPGRTPRWSNQVGFYRILGDMRNARTRGVWKRVAFCKGNDSVPLIEHGTYVSLRDFAVAR